MKPLRDFRIEPPSTILWVLQYGTCVLSEFGIPMVPEKGVKVGISMPGRLQLTHRELGLLPHSALAFIGRIHLVK